MTVWQETLLWMTPFIIGAIAIAYLLHQNHKELVKLHERQEKIRKMMDDIY